MKRKEAATKNSLTHQTGLPTYKEIERIFQQSLFLRKKHQAGCIR